MNREKRYAAPPHTVLVDQLYRPDQSIVKRTHIPQVSKIVTGKRTFFVLDGQRLYQTATHYEIRYAESAGLIEEIPLNQVIWVEPDEIPGWFDFEKKTYHYHHD